MKHQPAVIFAFVLFQLPSWCGAAETGADDLGKKVQEAAYANGAIDERLRAEQARLDRLKARLRDTQTAFEKSTCSVRKLPSEAVNKGLESKRASLENNWTIVNLGLINIERERRRIEASRVALEQKYTNVKRRDAAYVAAMEQILLDLNSNRELIDKNVIPSMRAYGDDIKQYIDNIRSSLAVCHESEKLEAADSKLKQDINKPTALQGHCEWFESYLKAAGFIKKCDGRSA